jgi:hypothetical protein
MPRQLLASLSWSRGRSRAVQFVQADACERDGNLAAGTKRTLAFNLHPVDEPRVSAASINLIFEERHVSAASINPHPEEPRLSAASRRMKIRAGYRPSRDSNAARRAC